MNRILAAIKRNKGMTAVFCSLLLLLGLAMLWRWSPLAEYLNVESIRWIISELKSTVYLPLILLLAYLIAGMTMFPMTVLNTAAVLVVGPWKGFEYAYLGNLASALFTFLVVRYAGRERLQRISGPKLLGLSRRAANKGLLSIIILRNLPIGFTTASMAAAVSHVSFRDYLLGSMLGMLPAILLICLLAGSIYNFLLQPKLGLAVGVAIAAAAIFALWKWFLSTRLTAQGSSDLERLNAVDDGADQ